jgi:hypothetical protein
MSLPIEPCYLEISSQPDEFYPKGRRKYANSNRPDFVYGGRIIEVRSRSRTDEQAMNFKWGNLNL